MTRVGRSCGFSMEHSLSGTCKVLDLKREKPLQGSRSLESQWTWCAESTGFLVPTHPHRKSSHTSLVPRGTDLILLERDGARAQKLRLNGGA